MAIISNSYHYRLIAITTKNETCLQIYKAMTTHCAGPEFGDTDVIDVRLRLKKSVRAKLTNEIGTPNPN